MSLSDQAKPSLRVTLTRDEVRGLALLAHASIDSAETEDDSEWWTAIADKLERALDRPQKSRAVDEPQAKGD